MENAIFETSMSAIYRTLALIGSCLVVACTDPSVPQPTTSVCYSVDIAPLLDAGCAKSGCHGPDLLDEDGMVVPYDLEGSELWEVITSAEADEHMPPRPWPSFDSVQRGLVQRWIMEGASRSPCDTPLDTTASAVTYDRTVKRIVDLYCVGCHYRQVSGSGPILTTYDRVRDEILNGHFMETIQHEDGYPPMPPGRTRMTEREIILLDVWMARGMPR
jgi:hypothetical protein